MNPKKDHEVSSLVALIQSLWPDPTSRPAHAMDLGSGRAHLSRSLTRPPLNMRVCAVDSSDSQLSGAERLDGFYKKQLSQYVSVEHRLQKLDCAQDITTLLDEWSADIESGPSTETATSTSSSPLVIALHACGDLSVSILRAFAGRASSKTNLPLSLILVGCCYNMLSSSSKSAEGSLPSRRVVMGFFADGSGGLMQVFT